MPGSTAERAEAIARASAAFPILGEVKARDLLRLVRVELGDARVLDEFRPCGDILSKAVAPRTILHVMSGNTPHAGLQSLIRGLLLGSHNRVKLPSCGLPELHRFREALPDPLAALIEFSETLSPEWQRSSDSIIVFGSDETIAKIRSQAHGRQKFLAHGHKVSFAIVFEDQTYQSIEAAARDVSLFNQQGCLSPHCIYVQNSGKLDPRTYAEKLAAAMREFEAGNPRGEVGREETAEIAHLRSSYQYRAANDPRVAIWESENSTAWTVIFEEEEQFAVSPLNRFVFIKPLPDLEDLPASLRLVKPHLSSIAIHPHREEHLGMIDQLGAHRICALGSSQLPSLFWHHDGSGVLSPLVKWVDFG